MLIADLDETKKKIEVVFDEFGQQLEQKVPHYEDLEKERLEQLGISGSAVRPNLEGSQAWQEELRTDADLEWRRKADHPWPSEDDE